jgi:Zn-dependent protease
MESDFIQNAPGEPQNSRSSRGMWAAVGGAILLVLAKGKFLLVALKSLSAGKLLLTFGSMFAMMAFEATRSGWLFACGFVLLILIHELGHGVAIKRAGLVAGYPIFIPFFGAMIALKGQPRSQVVEAEIALAGPWAGAGASVLTAALFLHTGDRFWLALAYTGFFLNLFNMTPFGFLDGGRVAKLLSKRSWIVGLAIFVGMFLFTHSPQLIIITLLALPQLFRRQPEPSQITATPKERRRIMINYFGLCAFLAAGTALCAQLMH